MDSVFEWRNYKTWVKLDCPALPNIVQWSMHTPCKMRQTSIVLHLRIWCDRCDLRALRSMEVSVVSTPMGRQVWQILKAESCSSQFVYDATVWITQFRVDRGREVQVVKPTFLLWCGCAWNVLLGKSKQLKIESRMCIEDQHYQAMAPAFRYRGTLVQLRCWDSATSKTWRSQVVLVESSLRSVSPRCLKQKPGEDDGDWRYEYHATPCAEGRISQYRRIPHSKALHTSHQGSYAGHSLLDDMNQHPNSSLATWQDVNVGTEISKSCFIAIARVLQIVFTLDTILNVGHNHHGKVQCWKLSVHAVTCPQASGHVDRFSDFLVRDCEDEKKFFRADKLLEDNFGWPSLRMVKQNYMTFPIYEVKWEGVVSSVDIINYETYDCFLFCSWRHY